MIKIPFCKSFIDGKEVRAVSRVLKSGWLTTGSKCAEFEKNFAEYVGSKYAVSVSSGTAAIKLSLKYFTQNMDSITVACPSLTFIATAAEIKNCGHSVKFIDIDSDNLCLDPDQLPYNVDIVMPVHLTGVEAFTAYNKPVVEDSAHRLIKNQCKKMPVNHLATFSFYPTKPITTGEGGMIATNDVEAYVWLKMARNHGIDKEDIRRYGKSDGWKYKIDFVGEKANMSDLQAAIGIEQLKKLPLMDKKRQVIVDKYNKILGYKNYGLHLYPIFVNDRDKFVHFLHEHGIGVSVHFQSLHKMKAFKEHNHLTLPMTEWASNHIVSLPLYPTLKDADIRYICGKIKKTKLLIPLKDLYE